jgi:hypothetical protein
MMMFNEVLALDDAILLLALRRTLCATQQCEHYYVLHDRFETQEPYVWDGETQRPWNPLHDWRDTMALAWRLQIELRHGCHMRSGGVIPWVCVHQSARVYAVQSEAEARLMICRLALCLLSDNTAKQEAAHG